MTTLLTSLSRAVAAARTRYLNGYVRYLILPTQVMRHAVEFPLSVVSELVYRQGCEFTQEDLIKRSNRCTCACFHACVCLCVHVCVFCLFVCGSVRITECVRMYFFISMRYFFYVYSAIIHTFHSYMLIVSSGHYFE